MELDDAGVTARLGRTRRHHLRFHPNRVTVEDGAGNLTSVVPRLPIGVPPTERPIVDLGVNIESTSGRPCSGFPAKSKSM